MKSDIINILKKIGAVLTDDHFVYTSGKHGDVYINKDALYPHTRETSLVGRMFAEKFKHRNVDIVVAPAVGGTILSQWTAYWLSKYKKREILSAYTEKDKGTLASASESEHIFRRGYDKLLKGKHVLVVEDLTTTGMSVKKVVKAVKVHGGKVVAVCVMVNRDPNHINSAYIGAPFSALDDLDAVAYEAKSCPLCKKNIPVNTNVGHGKQFIDEKHKAR